MKQTMRRHPEWIKARLPAGKAAGRIRYTLDGLGLHTICREARCPNRGECWDAGTATFLILGDNCTRNCRYCSVAGGSPYAPDPLEPRNLLEAVHAMECRYVVITSVTRDDLSDGGASAFVDCVRTLREQAKGVRIELLVPDFMGNTEAISKVALSQPDVIGHNIETVGRLFPSLRPQGCYERSLELHRYLRDSYPSALQKSGIMIGLGEKREEVTRAMRDLRDAGVDILTIGQYLQPARDSVPVHRYCHPDEFEEMRREALGTGFAAVMSGPMVRSSYRAESCADAAINRNAGRTA